MQMTKSKWFFPLFCVALGIVMLIAQAIGDHLGSGFVSLGIMVAFVVQLARGHNGNPYTWLAAIAGATYMIAVLVLRARR